MLSKNRMRFVFFLSHLLLLSHKQKFGAKSSKNSARMRILNSYLTLLYDNEQVDCIPRLIEKY